MWRWIPKLSVLLVLSFSAGCDLEGLAKGTESSDDTKDSRDDDDEPKGKKKKKGKKKGSKKKGKSDDDAPGRDETSGDERSHASDDTPASKPALAPRIDYFADASSIATMLSTKVGGTVRAKQILIYPTYGNADIQDPNKLLNLDRYDFRDGAVKDPTPIKMIGPKPTEALMLQNTFDITTVDFAVVPKLVADAEVKLAYEASKTTHIILKRNIPFDSNVIWRVYVTGERRSGSVSYDLKGATIKVYD